MFMKNAEGNDNDDNLDQSFWDNPNLEIAQQSLPSYENFFLAFPSHLDDNTKTALQVYTIAGGPLLAAYNQNPNKYSNTCAIRLSIALKNCGITIPYLPNRTFQGANNKYYFLNASEMIKWLKLTFGAPTGSNHLTGAQGGTYGENFKDLISGKRGIYAMTPNVPGIGGFEASGHVDILDNQIGADGGEYFNPKGGVKEIFIWQLN